MLPTLSRSSSARTANAAGTPFSKPSETEKLICVFAMPVTEIGSSHGNVEVLVSVVELVPIVGQYTTSYVFTSACTEGGIHVTVMRFSPGKSSPIVGGGGGR